MKILVVEDEASVRRMLEMQLTTAGMTVSTAANGEEAIDLATLYPFDLAILDLNLPDISGFEVLRQLRMNKVSVPVLILTGEATPETVLRGFTAGADDYLQKPYAGAELVARVRAIVRRTLGHGSSLIAAGDLTVDIEGRSVAVAGQAMTTTQREFGIIELLVLRKGTTVTKDRFLTQLYGGLDEPNAKIIDVYICRIRKKLIDLGLPADMIETVWGQGYRLHARRLGSRAIRAAETAA